MSVATQTAALVADVEVALRASLVDIAASMTTLAGSLNSESGVFLRDQGQQLVNLEQGLSDFLRNRAVPAVLNEVAEGASALLSETLSDHEGLGAFKPEIGEVLVGILEGQAQQVARDIVTTGTQNVMRGVVRSLIGGATIEDIGEAIAEGLDLTRQQAVTAIARGAREFSESTLKRMGEAQPDEFGYVYVGPTGGNVRDYCQARVGKVLTQAQADALESRERFNCRHSLAPIPMSLVAEEGLTIYQE